MLTDMESSGRQRRAASVIAIAAFAILNVAFYFLSGNYFDAHHQVVAGGPQGHPHRVQDVPVVHPAGVAPEQPERIGSPVGAVEARVLGRVDLAVPVGDVRARTRPGLPGQLEGRHDPDGPARRGARQQHPIGAVHE